MKFEFINDLKFKEILLRDYEELIKCYEIKASKSVLILCGSIVETILTEYFVDSLPDGKTKEDILKMSLGKLLELAEEKNVITSKIKKLSSVIQDYRNLIHPGREIRINESFSNEDSEISMSLLRIIVDSIKTKYSEKIKYTGTDVFEKLKNDWGFQSVYGIVITKLNFQERENLLELFIEFEKYEKSKFEYFRLEIEEDGQQEDKYGLVEIEEVKRFVKELKPLLKQEIIEKKLAELLHSVTTGEKVVTLSLYNLFHEELGLLKKDDQELIAIYMLSLLESISEESSKLSEEKTFSTIGKYIHTDKGLEKLKDFSSFAIVNYYWKKIEPEMNVFEQIFNSLNGELREKLKTHMDIFLTPEKGTLPNDILEGFVKEAVKRGLLDNKYNS
jgi:hypothetical protein